MHLNHHKGCFKAAVAASYLVLLLVHSSAFGDYVQPEVASVLSSSLQEISSSALQSAGYLSQPLSNEPPDQLERRTGGGGRGHQVAISVERVKNPDDAPGYRKKKKFPITWLRNQYPFNAYQSKKNKKKSGGYKWPGKYDPMMGQYSMQDNVEFLDPNPSTWLKIPDRPTASIKFQKQESPFSHNPLPPPPSLQFAPDTVLEPLPSMPLSAAPLMAGGAFSSHLPPHILMANQQAAAFAQQQHPVNRLPAMAVAAPSGGQSMMTSESQNDYSNQPGGGQKEEAPTGLGGVSLELGNGRSISFARGQGLTIGTRAGAISIGGKGGDNSASASGYSAETKGAGSGGYSAPAYGQQKQTGGYGSGGGGGSGSTGSGYGDGYVSKHPTMSVDVPRKGKSILHLNTDMAPFKVRVHSSPRVKITTGSRDPLEKPGEEELEEEEEDIFEPPVPFVKQNSTSAATNETSMTTTPSSNATEITTINPLLMQQFQQDQQLFDRYPQDFNQQRPYNGGQQQQQQQQVVNDYGGQYHYQQQQQLQGPYNNGPPGRQSQYQPVANKQPYQQQQQQNYHRAQPEQQFHHYPPQAVNPQYTLQVPFDEPPHFPPQQQVSQFDAGQHHPQANYQQFNTQDARPFPQPPVQAVPQMPIQPVQMMEPQMMNQAPVDSPPPMPMSTPPTMQQPSEAPVNGDQRPAVNQWRQYSREARQQMNRQLPKQQPDLANDPNPRFYNGGNSIVEPTQPGNNNRANQGFESRETIDMAASSSSRSFERNLNGLPVGAQKSLVEQKPVQQHRYSQPQVNQQHRQSPPQQQQQQQQPQQHHQRPQQQAPRTQQPQVKGSPQEAAKQTQQVLQSQESSNYGGSSYQQPTYDDTPHNSYEAPAKTYTFGSGGLSTSYGSEGAGDHHHGSGSTSSDGFDQKKYAAKVEKFDPDAHDKREKSKIVVFLKPRISITMANSSTTTKRPKNAQRFLNVINKPIFLNSTNNGTEHDDTFIDPDLAEPMEIGYGYGYGYGYGQGYGQGYGRGYGSARNYTKTTTTKKPKRTTTTTTTTAAPTTTSDSESTTTSSPSTSSDSEGSSSSSTDDSSSTSSSSTTEASPTTTTSESPSSTSTTTSLSSSEEPNDDRSTSATDSATTESPASEAAPSSTESSSGSSSLPTDVSIIDVQPNSDSEGERESTTTPESPSSSASPGESSGESEESVSVSSVAVSSSSPSVEDDAADLIMSATEPTAETTAPNVPTTTTTTPPTTTTTALPSSTTTTAKVPIKSRNTRPSTTSTSTTSTTTTTTTTTTSAPPTTTATPTTSSESPTESVGGQTDGSAVPSEEPEASSTTGASSAASEESPEFISEQQNPSKRSAQLMKDSAQVVDRRTPQSFQNAAKPLPMLLTPTLIDKLMSNRTLVSLMSSQLKRVIDTERMDEDEKRRIVRQVFDQMMEEKVDFSMNNVRLAVKTVSSSYRAAAEKQRKRTTNQSVDGTQTTSKAEVAKGKQAADGSSFTTRKLDSRTFGRRATATTNTTTKTTRDDQSSAGAKQQLASSSSSSRSFPVIDTALKLTKKQSPAAGGFSAGSTTDSSGSSSSVGNSNSKRVDSSGNPIVVVLLPQEKA